MFTEELLLLGLHYLVFFYSVKEISNLREIKKTIAFKKFPKKVKER